MKKHSPFLLLSMAAFFAMTTSAMTTSAEASIFCLGDKLQCQGKKVKRLERRNAHKTAKLDRLQAEGASQRRLDKGGVREDHLQNKLERERAELAEMIERDGGSGYDPADYGIRKKKTVAVEPRADLAPVHEHRHSDSSLNRMSVTEDGYVITEDGTRIRVSDLEAYGLKASDFILDDGNDQPTRNTDPNGGGATDPNGGGATDPNGGGATDPNGGGATDPNGGGATDPNGGGATDPNGGGATDPNGGGERQPQKDPKDKTKKDKGDVPQKSVKKKDKTGGDRQPKTNVPQKSVKKKDKTGGDRQPKDDPKNGKRQPKDDPKNGGKRQPQEDPKVKAAREKAAKEKREEAARQEKLRKEQEERERLAREERERQERERLERERLAKEKEKNGKGCVHPDHGDPKCGPSEEEVSVGGGTIDAKLKQKLVTEKSESTFKVGRHGVIEKTKSSRKREKGKLKLKGIPVEKAEAAIRLQKAFDALFETDGGEGKVANHARHRPDAALETAAGADPKETAGARSVRAN